MAPPLGPHHNGHKALGYGEAAANENEVRTFAALYYPIHDLPFVSLNVVLNQSSQYPPTSYRPNWAAKAHRT